MFERIGQRLRAYAEKDGRGYPDWALRYAPVVARLRGRPPGAIVEVGANANCLARFSPEPFVAVDREPANLEEVRAFPHVRVVRADATALPFADGSVDVLICMDLIEHVPPGDRWQVAREILRVLDPQGLAAVSFPTGRQAADAERAIGSEYRQQTGRALHWLEEHGAMGLPESDEIVTALCANGGMPRRIGVEKNAPLWLWKWIWRILLCGWPGRGNALAQAFLRWTTPLVCRIAFGTCYRCIVWIEPE